MRMHVLACRCAIYNIDEPCNKGLLTKRPLN
uniref:Uncharacterized protein n=1 Tax=Arundo donax TaxID=35708 RepID=A0A0A9E032_ARUDO